MQDGLPSGGPSFSFTFMEIIMIVISTNFQYDNNTEEDYAFLHPYPEKTHGTFIVNHLPLNDEADFVWPLFDNTDYVRLAYDKLCSCYRNVPQDEPANLRHHNKLLNWLDSWGFIADYASKLDERNGRLRIRSDSPKARLENDASVLFVGNDEWLTLSVPADLKGCRTLRAYTSSDFYYRAIAWDQAVQHEPGFFDKLMSYDPTFTWEDDDLEFADKDHTTAQAVFQYGEHIFSTAIFVDAHVPGVELAYWLKERLDELSGYAALDSDVFDRYGSEEKYFRDMFSPKIGELDFESRRVLMFDPCGRCIAMPFHTLREFLVTLKVVDVIAGSVIHDDEELS